LLNDLIDGLCFHLKKIKRKLSLMQFLNSYVTLNFENIYKHHSIK